MCGAKVGTNPVSVPFYANQTRPGGASAMAESKDPEHLLIAIRYGNRQTRRLALRNAKKLMKQGGPA